MSSLLYACTKCHTKFPLGKLSKSSMICISCTNAMSAKQPSKMCTYCREDYLRLDEKTICMKCEQSESQYGKPRSCDVCNIIAAFIGSKCKRCVVSEKKWGAPISCEQCKQRCAFNRPEPERQTDKTLCWLCTVAYKRVLAKAKRKEQSQGIPDKKSRKRRASKEAASEASSVKRSSSNGSIMNLDTKKFGSSLEEKRLSPPNHDANIIIVTQLREEVESLKKTLTQKERLILQKDRKMTELKTVQMEMERHYKEKIDVLKSSHTKSIDSLRKRNGDLLKQIASLSKNRKLNVAATSNSATNSPLI